jgi:DNA-binding LytR/AlgR family response regulator
MNVLNLTPRVQVPMMDVLYFESSRNYTYIYLKNGKKRLLCKTLGLITPELPATSFLRVSRSHVVNLNYLHSIIERDTVYYAHISEGSHLPISRRRLKNMNGYL